MILSGSLVIEGKNIRTAGVKSENGSNFHQRFEKSFIELCHQLHIPVPIWFDKNTKELAMCKKTSFFPDQFSEEFCFDRFELRVDRI